MNKVIDGNHRLNQSTGSISDILIILAKNINLITLTTVIVSLLTLIYAIFIVDPIYISKAKIMSSSGGGSFSQTSNLAAQFGISIVPNQGETKWAYPDIIKSKNLAKIVLKQKFNTNQFGPSKTLLQILTYGNEKPKFGLDTLETLAADNLLDMIYVNEDKKTSVLTLKISASEPKLASDINHALIKQLDIHQKKYNRNKTSDAKIFIEERIIDIEKELIEAEENLKVFKDRNRRIENSPALQLEQQRLSREVTVLIGVFTTLKQQLETTKIEEVKESDYVVIVDSPDVPLHRSKPQKMIMLITAIIFGFALGTSMSFIKEYFKRNGGKEIRKIKKAKNIFIDNISKTLIFKR